MAEMNLRLQSQLIGYSPVEYPYIVPDGLTPEEVAELHWEYNLRFLTRQEEIANRPVTPEQEASIAKAAIETVDSKLKATKISEHVSEGELALAASSGVGDVEAAANLLIAEQAAPWEAEVTPVPEKKPWESKPKFDLF